MLTWYGFEIGCDEAIVVAVIDRIAPSLVRGTGIPASSWAGEERGWHDIGKQPV